MALTMVRLVEHPVDDAAAEAQGLLAGQQLGHGVLALELATAVVREPGHDQ